MASIEIIKIKFEFKDALYDTKTKNSITILVLCESEKIKRMKDVKNINFA